MATVRNPLAGFAITIFGALALAFLAGIPILFLPQAELVYFYLPFALFGVGMLSGRSGFLGTLGFVGGTLGGFVGIYVFQTLFVPRAGRSGPPAWRSSWTSPSARPAGPVASSWGESGCDGSTGWRTTG